MNIARDEALTQSLLTTELLEIHNTQITEVGTNGFAHEYKVHSIYCDNTFPCSQNTNSAKVNPQLTKMPCRVQEQKVMNAVQ